MTMRFGLVGTGFWAKETHAAALAAHPNATLAGVWGRSSERAVELAAAFGIPAFDDLDKMIDAVDAVAIAVPPDAQAEIAVRAADRGKHLLLDKPVALTTSAADKVVEAVDRNGVRSVVLFTLRFTDNIAAWLGASLQADHWLSADIRLCADIFQPGNPFGGSAWRKEQGPLWDIGPHAMSVILPLLGPVERVVAERGCGDSVVVILRHRDGGTSTLTLQLDAPTGSQGSSWRAFGKVGSTEMPATTSSPLEATGHAVTALVESCQTGAQAHPLDVHFGREVVAVLEAASDFLARDPRSRSARV
jgi:predicted dehydrogenase